MKTKFLYLNGTYVHTNQELRNTILHLIDEGTNNDALIRLLSDLYHNGHLREFCQQEEYENEINKKNYKIAFDTNITGDIRVANHVAARLKGDDNYAPFYGDFHKHFNFFDIHISRQDEPSIESIISSTRSQDERDHIYLLNGFRQQIYLQRKALIVITYSIDIKEVLSEQIPIYVNGEKADITIDLSKAKKEKEINIPIKESLLDPVKDIEVLFGQEGSYGRIILKAPQITIPIQFRGKTILYPMMRIFQKYNYYYMGVWPFEYDNTQDWEKIVHSNWFLEENYSHRRINFYLDTDVKGSFPENYQKELFSQIVWKKETPLETPPKGHWRIGIPSKDEWEEASLLEKDTTLKGSIISKYTINLNCGLSSNDLKQHVSVRPNAFGLYAMLGNIHELALNDTTPYYMGGDLRVREETKEIDLAPVDRNHINRLSIFCLRFIIHNTDFNDIEAVLDEIYREQHKNDNESNPLMSPW